MDPHKTGTFIAALRRGKNMTQEDLAGAVGVTDKAVSRWEVALPRGGEGSVEQQFRAHRRPSQQLPGDEADAHRPRRVGAAGSYHNWSHNVKEIHISSHAFLSSEGVYKRRIAGRGEMSRPKEA